MGSTSTACLVELFALLGAKIQQTPVLKFHLIPIALFPCRPSSPSSNIWEAEKKQLSPFYVCIIIGVAKSGVGEESLGTRPSTSSDIQISVRMFEHYVIKYVGHHTT